MRSLFAALIVLVAVISASAQSGLPDKSGIRALKQMADTPVQGRTAEALKSAADVQMAPVAGMPAAPTVPAASGVILPAADEPNEGYHGGPVKQGASKGYKIGVDTVRWTGSVIKLPFAAVGGVIGGIIGATKAMFAKDDDDHNNNVGAGFMLGASAAGHYSGKVIQALLTIPALVVGAVGSIIGGVVGFFKGLFTKSENK